MKQHKWQPNGGCDQNPGVYDNGNGGLITRSVCVRCALQRERGSDYTGCRPGNNFGPRYKLPSGRIVGAISCDPDRVAQLDVA